MTDDHIEGRLHSALDELTATVPLLRPDAPRSGPVPGVPLTGGDPRRTDEGSDDEGTGDGRQRRSWTDPKVLVIAGCAVVLIAVLAFAEIGHVLRPKHPSTVSTSTSIPAPVTTTAPTTTTTVPATDTTPTGSPQGGRLPISVQSDSEMRAAGNNGPTSSILIPSTCEFSGDTVAATGTYQGGFAPDVYNRVGDVVVLYVFGTPSPGYPQGIQLAVSPVGSSPAMGSGVWQVSATFDPSLGQPATCEVAAQPTHDLQLAP